MVGLVQGLHAVQAVAAEEGPKFAKSAFEYLLHDERYVRIAMGLISIGFGGTLIVMSTCKRKINNIRWGHVNYGFVMICFGVFCIASGFIFVKADKETCEQRVFRAVQQIKECPESFTVWQKMEKAGPFTIHCVTSDLSKRATFNRNHREIRINENYLDVTEGVLFELLNMKHEDKKLYKMACSMDENQYAIADEKREYKALKEYHEIAEKCISRDLWAPDLNGFREYFQGEDTEYHTFEGYLKVQELNGHTDAIRNRHREVCKLYKPQGKASKALT